MLKTILKVGMAILFGLLLALTGCNVQRFAQKRGYCRCDDSAHVEWRDTVLYVSVPPDTLWVPATAQSSALLDSLLGANDSLAIASDSLGNVVRVLRLRTPHGERVVVKVVEAPHKPLAVPLAVPETYNVKYIHDVKDRIPWYMWTWAIGASVLSVAAFGYSFRK